MNSKFEQKMKIVHPGHLGRRMVALILAAAMLLPTVALGWDEQFHPTPMVEGEAPTITVEANAVVDRWYDPDGPESAEGYLTGDLEVAIRVKSGKIGEEWQGFNTLSLALKYHSLLTPYAWSVQSGWSNPAAVTPEGEVLLDGTKQFSEMVNTQTLKNNKISTALTHISSAGEDGGGYLYIQVEANRPVVLEEDTVLAVVRFKYFTDDISELYDKEIKVDDEAIGAPLEADAAQWMDPENGLGLIQFAAPEEIDDNRIGPELYYESANNDLGMGKGNGMFYSADPDSDACANLEVTVPDGSGGTTTSRTQNLIPLNQSTYDAKAVEPNHINFTLVNKTTYNDGGLSLDDLATVLFYDWDNTLIGVLVVPKNGDSRKLVNEYVRDNMIHPDLRPGDTYTPNYSSLARTDNYRGKYPSTEPKPEGGSDGTEDSGRTDGKKGRDYPLTNKLDYVFVKRPMEQMTEDADGNAITTNTWRQKGTEEAAEWDEYYPYIHGWALIPDDNLADIQYTHPENIWTTIGVAELSSFTGLNNGAYTNVSDIATGPAELVATDKNFKFADFDFRKSNGNSLEAGSVYAVKAVYEPGQELMNAATSYRMISKPYYNKMNYPSAAKGAAYSVDITFERASTATGPVRGISRIRQPDIRQDTTADIRWEDQYLNNADVDEEVGKGKSSYTNVVVDNADEVEIRLVLSARQNKVDYFLINSFGSSFVTGGARSSTNSEYKDEEHVIDNYNYKTNTSDVTVDGVSADYYDAPYEDRDGSHGFVLYGTLNNMAQKLTEDYNGALSTLDFNNFISLDNMNDINLRSYNNEKPAARTLPDFRSALRAAVEEAAKRHDPDDLDYPGTDDRAWDVEHGYAQFTYHQLQLFVSDYLDPDVTTPTLRTAEDADTVSIKWCHLHENCAAEASGKPRSWEQLVATAQRTDKTRNEKIEILRLLSLDEQKAMTHLRAKEDGTHFANNRAFAIAWIDAVEAGNTTWDTIQDYIARNQSDASYAQATYWWYDDDTVTRIPFNSLADTVAAVQDLIYPKTVPGETTPVARSAKLNQLKSAFDANADSDAVDTNWNRATKNLAITKDGEEAQKFASWSDFTDYFSKAVKAAQDAGVKLEFADDDDADAIAKKTRSYWEKLQYHILSRENDLTKPGKYPTTPTPTTGEQDEMDGYWWYDGAVKVTNLATLIQAAQDANSGKPASMDMFKYSALYDLDNKELHFARNFKGEKYTSADDADTDNNDYLVFSEFKEAIMDYVQADRTYLRSNDPDWNRVQYYLIHAVENKETALNDVDRYGDYEAAYYWWKEGKDPQPVDFTLGGSANDENPVARADALAVALLDAAFRATYNGNTAAWDNLTADVLESGRLVKGSTGSEATFPDDFTMYSDSNLSDLETAVVALMQKIGGTTPTFPAPTATWHQVQHYALTAQYQTDAWLQYYTNYWWEDTESLGRLPVDLFQDLQDKIAAVAAAKGSGGDGIAEADALRGWFTEEIAEKLEFTSDGASLVTQGELSSIPWEGFNYSVCGSPFTVTWAQIEWMFIGNIYWYGMYQLDDDSTARDMLGMFGFPADPQGWAPYTIGTYRVKRVAASPDFSVIISSINDRIDVLMMGAQKYPDAFEKYKGELEELFAALEELKLLLGTGELPAETTETPEPMESLEPTGSPEPAESVTPTESVEPAESPEPTESAEPTESLKPAESPAPTVSAEPTESSDPTESPNPTESPDPTVSVEPAESPAPTEAPDPSEPPDEKKHLVTVPEEVTPPLISTENDGKINNPTGSEDPPEDPSQAEQQQEKGGDDMMTTNINNSGNVSMLPSAFLLTDKVGRATNGIILAEVLVPEGTTEIVDQRPGRLALPGGQAYPSEEDKLWRRPKPKIAASPGRLISISTELLAALKNERRAQG